MNGFGMTDRGKQRKENQDCFAMRMSDDRRSIVAVVCDGMGGARAGNVASQLAAETFISGVDLLGDTPAQQMKEILVKAVTETNRVVFDKAMSSSEYSGMGTTLVGAVVNEDTALFINVGDSRAYHISGTDIDRLTRDHSVVEDMVLRGDLTPEQARRHPNKNLITKAIGTESEVLGDIYEVSLKDGDYLLLCSDGLTNLIGDQELLSQCRKGEGLDDICQALVEMALEKGAPDNVTVVLLEI